MRKVKVLFFMPSLDGGGAEKVVYLLLKHLNRNIFDLNLMLVRKEGYFLNNIPKDINIFSLNKKKVRNSFFDTIKIVNSLKPDVLFVSHVDLNLFTSLEKIFFNSSIKLICRETNIPSIRNRLRKNKFIYEILYRNFLIRADYIILQSEAIKRDLLKFYNVNLSKVKVINNPIEIPNIKKLKNVFDKNKFNILSVGRFSEHKNFKELIEIFKDIKLSNAILHIVGDGKQRKDLEKLIKSYNLEEKVKLYFFKENILDYMYSADLFVLTSKYEGFSNVILEALSVGTPCIAYEDLGGIEETIKDGLNGYKVERGNLSQFRHFILKSFYKNWSRESIIRTVLKFDVNNIVKEYEKVIMDSMGN